jgi:hypothetical protein
MDPDDPGSVRSRLLRVLRLERPPSTRAVLLAGLVLWLAVLVLPTVADPLTRLHEETWQSLLARRFLEDGDPSHLWADYVHHPPLLPALTAGLYGILGMEAWVYRVLPLVSTAAAAGLLVPVLDRLGARRPWAGVAGACYLFLPMVAYYWRRNGYEQLTLALSLLLLLAYLRWSDLPGSGDDGPGTGATVPRMAAVGGLSVVGGLADWPYALYGGALALDGWILRPDPDRRRLSAAAVVGTTAGVFLFLGLALWSGGNLMSLWTRLVTEYSSSSLGLPLAVAELAFWFTWGFTAVGVALVLWPVAEAVRRTRSAGEPLLSRAPFRSSPWAVAYVLLAVPALLNVIMFWENAVHHRFWLYYFGPVVALGLAQAGTSLGGDGGGREPGEPASGPPSPGSEGGGSGGPSPRLLPVALAVALVAGGATMTGFEVYATNHPSVLEAYDHVEGNAEDDDVVTTYSSRVGERAKWYIDEVDVTFLSGIPGDRNRTSWVIYYGERADVDFGDRLASQGYEKVGDFPTKNLAGLVEYPVWVRNATASQG